MKNCIFLIVFVLFLGCQSQTTPQQQEGYPQVEITNGLITAKLYLPDAERGYYIGSRFDWSGVIAELKYLEHDYFGQWYPTRDPKIHDAISGPVGEFMQIGYAEAPVGGEFLRIGIGGLRKATDAPFERYGYYEFSNPGKWTVQTAPDHVVFTHELNDVAGYSYLYEKTVRLAKDKPQMILEHSLKNTGEKAIQTSTYNHNFFYIDNQPTGPDFVVRFAFFPNERELPNARIIGQEIEYLSVLEPTETASFGGLQGFSGSVEEYDFRIENLKTGAGVRITGDKPILRFVYWSCGRAISPEPYIDLNIQPGESFSWNIYYNFYSLGTPPSAAR
jgi:hypothetical protein